MDKAIPKSSTRLYRAYHNMLYRCNPKNLKKYETYYLKGIRVCDEWINNYYAFVEWAENNGYSDNLTLDRIDNNKGYEASNCRWVTMLVQQHNKGKNKRNKTGVVGVLYNKARKKFKAYITMNYKTTELGFFVDKEDAVNARKRAEIEYNFLMIGA